MKPALTKEQFDTFLKCCQVIKREYPGNETAKAYANSGIAMITARQTGNDDWSTTDEAIRVQALYILSNIAMWRSQTAKDIRTFLKGIAS